MKTSFRKRAQAGFTLIEMLIVIGLIGLVVALTVTRFGDIFSGSQADAAKQFVDNSLDATLLKYRMDMGSYPTTAEGIAALLNQPTGAKANRWRGPYIEKLPDDPWGNPYNYKAPGSKNPTGFDLWSSGPDGQSGTADDIGNWE